MTSTMLFFVSALILWPPSVLGGTCGDRPSASWECHEPNLGGESVAVVSDGRTLIAVTGRGGEGFSVWARNEVSADVEPLYQDLGHPSREVRLVWHGGIQYAFAAGRDGVFVYDLTQAQSLAQPCFDDAGAVCPGVFQGRLGDARDVVALDVLERDGVVYVAIRAAGASADEIWALANPAIPAMAVREFSEAAGSLAGPSRPRSTRYVAMARLGAL